MMNILQLKKEITEVIDAHKKKFPAVSLNSIAKKAGRSEATLRKILSLENQCKPRPDTLLNLMMVILQKRDVQSVLTESPGLIGEYLNRSFPIFSIPPRTNINAKIDNEITDREGFFIVWLAGAKSGTHRDEIKNLMGEFGEQRLDELIACEALTVEENGSIRTVDENPYISPDVSKKFIGEFFRFWKIDQMAEGNNIMYGILESISDECRNEVIKILSEPSLKIRELVHEPKTYGNKKIISLIYDEYLGQL